MNNESAKKVLFDRKATKAQLREALAFVLNVECNFEKKERKQTIHTECKMYFCTSYEKYTGISYIYTGKDARALSQLIEKIGGILATNTDDNVVNTFKALIEKLPEWYKINQFSLSVINSKFNEIVSSIKQDGKSKSGVSESYKERILREMRTNASE